VTASARGDLFSPACPTRQFLDRIGGKWTSMLVKVLADAGPEEVRFAELKRRAPGISQKMLAQTLRELERDGLVTRRVEPATPPRVFYGLTERGDSLEDVLLVLRDWAETHMPDVSRSRRDYDAA
jgi:DNA-binding HxlR family transcriptional regulator